MPISLRRVLVFAAAALTATVSATFARGAGSPAWAIRDARIVSPGAPVIDKGTVVLRNGLIEAAGAGIAVPPDAVVIDGAGLSVYPGLIDLANSPAPAEAAGAAGRGAAPAGGGGAAPANTTLADLERARRAALLRADVDAARTANVPAAEMRRLTAAGITSVLAVPPGGLLRGQSALINVAPPPDAPHISVVGDYRQGVAIVRSPVASHIAFNTGRGAAGYPGSLLGYIAFVRQSLLDAQWQRDARAYSERHTNEPRPIFEPVLDALAPVLEGKIPVAFEASSNVEIQRALSMAREFKLTPIIVGAAEAAPLAADLKAANARVIYSLNFPVEPGRGGRGAQGRGGAGAAGGAPPPEETVRARQLRVNAPKVPAALLAAGVPFAFGSSGLQNPADFVRNAARTVSEGGLSADAALRALTSGAATLAGAGDRLGTIAAGRIANVIVTEGDLFAANARIRHVFVDGYPIEIVETPAETGRGRAGS
jgi:imidazolonepropionase-like amidohydrolase